MKIIKLHYVKNNEPVYVNTKFIISFEPCNESNKKYTEIISLTDSCFNVKESCEEILSLINRECNTSKVTDFPKKDLPFKKSSRHRRQKYKRPPEFKN